MISSNIDLDLLIRSDKHKIINFKLVGAKAKVPKLQLIFTCIWLLIPILPSFVPTTVGCDEPTAMIAPCFEIKPYYQRGVVHYMKTEVETWKVHLTVPGGKIASNLSTPNIPRFERVKVPAD